MLKESQSVCGIKGEKVHFNEERNEFVNRLIDKFVNAKHMKQSHEYYQERRNTSSLKKAEDDDFLGKKAEFGVLYHLIYKMGFPKINVDLEVRRGGNKGWRIDLPFKEKDSDYPNTHVKACSRQWGGDYSWTFQFANNRGPGGRDPIFDGPDDDLVALVVIETLDSADILIKAIRPWGEIKKHLKDPFKESLVGLKKCVYLCDLMEAM